MESRLSDRKLKPLPPDPFRHQNSAIAPATHASVTERLSRACNPWEARNRLTGSSRRACSRLPLVEPSLRQSTLARSGAVTGAPLVLSSKQQPVLNRRAEPVI